jgi:hypothetical protein
MENIKNVSSEEELLQLRNEGNITEAEYKELLEMLHKGPKTEITQTQNYELKKTQTSGLATASLVFSILSIILWPLGFIPGIVCGHLARNRINKNPSIKGYGLAVSGLIIGYVFFGLFLFYILLFMSFKGSD